MPVRGGLRRGARGLRPGRRSLLWVGFALAAVSVTWWADRGTTWSAALADPPATGRPLRQDIAPLRPALLGALLAGAPAATTALLWSVLGGAGIAGALSGDLVRRLGPHATWAATAVVMAGATTVLVEVPDRVLPAAAALAGFGASYVVLSGVLIAYATIVTPQRAAESTAALFVALTVGQALGAAGLGAIAGATSLTASFLGAAGLILLSIVAATRQTD